MPTTPHRAPLPTDPQALPPTEVGTLAALIPMLVAAGLPQLSSEEIAVIGVHLRLLDAWNPSINLTRITGEKERAAHHLLDALVAVPLLTRLAARANGNGVRIADLGSGGGFPGVPAAARILASHPMATMDLIEATLKKARFLEVVVAATELAPQLSVRAERAELLARPGGPRYDLILSRAVAPLAELTRLATPLLAPGGMLIAWKRDGASWPAELATATSLIGAAAIRVERVSAPALAGSLLVVVDPAAREGRAEV